MYRLKNVLRPYAWGSATAMAELFGREPSGGPEAELWIGAHPDSPSSMLLPGGTEQPLDAFIAERPDSALGGEAIRRFGTRLPFLAKVLAADSALSLQVHPSQEQARAGYAAETAARIPASDPARSYKDDNHKPEMIYALTISRRCAVSASPGTRPGCSSACAASSPPPAPAPPCWTGWSP